MSGPSCCFWGFQKHQPTSQLPPLARRPQCWPHDHRWTCQAPRALTLTAACPAAPPPPQLPGSWAYKGSGDASIGRGWHFVIASCLVLSPLPPVQIPVFCYLLNKM